MKRIKRLYKLAKELTATEYSSDSDDEWKRQFSNLVSRKYF
jgi:hypothetical protein